MSTTYHSDSTETDCEKLALDKINLRLIGFLSMINFSRPTP